MESKSKSPGAMAAEVWNESPGEVTTLTLPMAHHVYRDCHGVLIPGPITVEIPAASDMIEPLPAAIVAQVGPEVADMLQSRLIRQINAQIFVSKIQ